MSQFKRSIIYVCLLVCIFSQRVVFSDSITKSTDVAFSQWIAEIEKETLEESFLGLQITNDYFVNLIDDPVGILFKFAGKVQPIERYEILRILSNRRFLRVWQELSNLKSEERKQLITRFFRQFSQKHASFFSKKLELSKDGVNYLQKYGSSTSIGSVESPTLWGVRYAFMSTIMLAGLYGDEDVLSDLILMGENMEQQYEEFKSQMVKEKQSYYDAVWYFDIVKNIPLICNAVLSIGLSVEASRNIYTGPFHTFEKNTPLEFGSFKLSAWNAEIGLYDVRHHQYGREVDYSKGKFELRHLINISPEYRDELFKIAKTYTN